MKDYKTIYEVTEHEFNVLREQLAGAIFSRKTDDGKYLIKTLTRFEPMVEKFVGEVKKVS